MLSKYNFVGENALELDFRHLDSFCLYWFHWLWFLHFYDTPGPCRLLAKHGIIMKERTFSLYLELEICWENNCSHYYYYTKKYTQRIKHTLALFGSWNCASVIRKIETFTITHILLLCFFILQNILSWVVLLGFLLLFSGEAEWY